VSQPWHGIVIEVTGDEATVDLRREGSVSMVAEVELARWGLHDVMPGDVLVLDTDAGTVTRLELPAWTQQELDAVHERAREMAAWFEENVQ
jgi:hypothetical protein